MKYKIVAGPDEMRVERFFEKSRPVKIGSEHIDANSEIAKNLYYDDIHEKCQNYIKKKREIHKFFWNHVNEKAQAIVEGCDELHFDGPAHIVSTVPWKQAVHGEWFIVSRRMRNAIIKKVKEKNK